MVITVQVYYYYYYSVEEAAPPEKIQVGDPEDGNEKEDNSKKLETCLKVTEAAILSLVLLTMIGLFTLPTIYYGLPFQEKEVSL